jgi:hypothetical protein
MYYGHRISDVAVSANVRVGRVTKLTIYSEGAANRFVGPLSGAGIDLDYDEDIEHIKE